MSNGVDNDDVEVKMSSAKRNAWIYFSCAVGYAFLISIGVYAGFFSIFSFALHALVEILCVAMGFHNVSRYRRFRDQFEGLEVPSDEAFDAS